MTNTLHMLCLPGLVARRGRFVPTGRPNPTELPSLVKPGEVEQHRSLFCAAYDQCLDVANRRGWRSWTCRCCKLFQFTKEMHVSESAHEATRRPFEEKVVTLFVLRSGER